MDYSCQAPLSMKFSRQEYWSGLPFSALGDILVPGIKPTSLVSSALAGGFFTMKPAGEPLYICIHFFNILFLKKIYLFLAVVDLFLPLAGFL